MLQIRSIVLRVGKVETIYRRLQNGFGRFVTQEFFDTHLAVP